MPATNHPHYDTDRLKAVSISSVISRFNDLKLKGHHYISICPWHEDKHPSLTIYENGNENRCHCFSCGKGGGPVSYVMQRMNCSFLDACAWISREFNIPVGGRNDYRPMTIRTLVRVPEKKPARDFTYLPMEYVDKHVSAESSLAKCMFRLWDPYRVEQVIEEYRLGIYEDWKYNDNVLFPCIDEKGRVHNIKYQHYCCDIDSPDFFHSAHGHTYWIGKRLAKAGIVAADAVFDNDCLFGAHLLGKYPGAKVVLVESPKNAVVGALACPQYVWVAAGNKGMLKPNVLECLRNRNVIVYPDRDAITEWKETLSRMKSIANFTVSDFCESNATVGNEKFDIADFIIDSVLHSTKA